MSRNKKRNAPLKTQLIKLKPITNNQQLAFDEMAKNQNLVLHGYAGTGKTLISMYMALDALFNDDTITNIIIVRSAVPTQDIGHLPGTYEEKIAPYEEPYESICDFLFKTGGSYEQLKDLGFITFMPISFIRGVTFDNAFIIVDEAQNNNFHALDSVMTRVGNNTKIIFAGDFTQSDLKKASDRDDINKFISILDDMEKFSHVEFGEQDIVRSELVKDYIIRKHKRGFD